MKKHLLSLAFLFIASLLYSLGISSFSSMSNESQSALVQSGALRESTNSPSDLTLFPKTQLASTLFDTFQKQNPKSNVMGIYYTKGAQADPLKFLNGLLKVSTLSGLEFYSRSEKKKKTLIYSVAVIDDNGNTLRDPQTTSLGSSTSFIINQDDETFGVARYMIDVKSAKNGEILIHIKNIDPLKKGIITMAKPGDFDFLLGAFYAEGALFIYGLSTNKNAPPSFVRKQADESLFNRIDAFSKWAMAAYEKAK